MIKKILIAKPWFQTSNEYQSDKKDADFIATSFYDGDSIEIADRLNGETLYFDRESLTKLTKFLNEICADLEIDLK